MVYYIKPNKLFSVLDNLMFFDRKCGDSVQNNFRVILAKKELTVTDISRDTGISRTTLNSLFYKRAKGIQFQTLEALCIYLNCTVGDLFEITKEAV